MNSQLNLSELNTGNDCRERSCVLFWDGRLDNRSDLILRLKDSLRGDTSNPALAMAAYQRWGIDGFVHLIGDWSLVIHDHAEGAVILASDFAGVRPLYYCVHKGRILWSSRLQSLVWETRISELDEDYIRGFLLFGGCPNRTPYRGIHSVPPGHAVRVLHSDTRLNRFWSLPVNDEIRYRNERRYAEQLRSLFHEAVAVRLQNQSPVLAELSGGLDSSSVVCLASHLIDSGAVPASRLTGVSFVWRNSLDEPFIRDMKSHCGIEGVQISTHDVPVISESQAGRAMPESFFPLRASTAAVADSLGARTVLTGQGGDLMMGNWFDDSLQVAASLRRFRLGRACKEAFAWSRIVRRPVYSIVWRALQAAVPPSGAPAAIYSTLDGSYSPKRDETSLLPMSDAISGAVSVEAQSILSDSWMQAPPERRKHFRCLSTLLELRQLQAPEAVEHLDYTHPFAHRPLVEFLMTVPVDVLCRPGEPRRLMRSALSDLWPLRLRQRRSKGLFGSPWQEALQPLAHALLKARRLQVAERGFVDRASVLSRLQRLATGIDCNLDQLRQIIVLEFWLRNQTHVGRPAAEQLAA